MISSFISEHYQLSVAIACVLLFLLLAPVAVLTTNRMEARFQRTRQMLEALSFRYLEEIIKNIGLNETAVEPLERLVESLPTFRPQGSFREDGYFWPSDTFYKCDGNFRIWIFTFNAERIAGISDGDTLKTCCLVHSQKLALPSFSMHPKGLDFLHHRGFGEGNSANRVRTIHPLILKKYAVYSNEADRLGSRFFRSGIISLILSEPLYEMEAAKNTLAVFASRPVDEYKLLNLVKFSTELAKSWSVEGGH